MPRDLGGDEPSETLPPHVILLGRKSSGFPVTQRHSHVKVWAIML